MDFSITLIIVIVTVIISLPGFSNREVIERLKHSPYMEIRNKEWYRLLTSGFVHADWWHLGVNMYVLYEFGGIVEDQSGSWIR